MACWKTLFTGAVAEPYTVKAFPNEYDVEM
jgi:hypothetical protein